MIYMNNLCYYLRKREKEKSRYFRLEIKKECMYFSSLWNHFQIFYFKSKIPFFLTFFAPPAPPASPSSFTLSNKRLQLALSESDIFLWSVFCTAWIFAIIQCFFVFFFYYIAHFGKKVLLFFKLQKGVVNFLILKN